MYMYIHALVFSVYLCQAIEAAKDDIEKTYSLEEAKEQAMQMHKQAEEEMKSQVHRMSTQCTM